MFLAFLLRNAAAHIFPWLKISTATPGPSPRPVAGIDPVPKTQTVARPKRRPHQAHPTLWSVRSSDAWQRVYCGPTAVAAAIGADVDEVVRTVQRNRRNYRPVKGTSADELQRVLWHFGHDLQLVADLSRNSPTLAGWERERTDWEFEKPLLVIVTGHWVAVRGRWLVDTWTAGKPVRLSDAPWRRKRVRFVYCVNLVNANRVVRDDRTRRIIRCV